MDIFDFKSINTNTEYIIGKNVKFGRNIVFGSNCKEIIIGYGSFLGDDIYIDVPYLSIGEYTTIHKNTTIHGYKPCKIGNNCWIGQNCIIDSIGDIEINNNVGVGAYSQIWTHSKFGDSLEGCKWNKTSKLIVEDDVWFSGHCIVTPIIAHKKSMLMVGGVITKNMKENHVYGGAPAVDLTDKLGSQFISKSIEEKKEIFKKLYLEFLNISNIMEENFEIIVEESIDINKNYQNLYDSKTVFFLNERKYIPNRSEHEYKFMKYLLYDKAKFNPINIK